MQDYYFRLDVSASAARNGRNNQTSDVVGSAGAEADPDAGKADRPQLYSASPK